jgi:hypothetical protein
MEPIKLGPDSRMKIRLKHRPKQYKSGEAGLAGRERLLHRLAGLAIEAYRHSEKAATPADADWGRALHVALVKAKLDAEG